MFFVWRIVLVHLVGDWRRRACVKMCFFRFCLKFRGISNDEQRLTPISSCVYSSQSKSIVCAAISLFVINLCWSDTRVKCSYELTDNKPQRRRRQRGKRDEQKTEKRTEKKFECDRERIKLIYRLNQQRNEALSFGSFSQRQRGWETVTTTTKQKIYKVKR